MLKKQGQEVNEDGQVVQTKKSTASSGSGSGGRTTEKGGTGGGTATKKNSREAAEPQERTGAVQFTREVRSELRKVNWPTRAEVINYSIVVIVTVIVLTVFIGVLDWIFSSTVLELFKPRS